MDQQELKEQFERNKGDFILVEVESGLTFAKVALDAEDEEKLNRNRKNARKAYDTACRFLQESVIKDEELRRKALTGLAELRRDLQELGEKFPE